MITNIALPLFAFALSAPLVSAQHTHPVGTTSPTAPAAPTAPNAQPDWMAAAMAAHMAYTPVRPLASGDSAKSAVIVAKLRDAVAKYTDYRAAEADGYKMFAPEMKDQPQYHFTKNWNAVRNQFGFDPARPTSLLYKRDEAGNLKLIGAMYTASKRTSAEELDEMIPLSVARWHRHVNWCVPPRRSKDRWKETQDGRPVFGPLGVATEAECKTAEGRFFPQVFGWMVHANIFAGNDLRAIWHDDHMEHEHAMIGAPKGSD